jgi:hypothetical protein
LWTHKARFKIYGVINVHIIHLWTRDNPQAIGELGIKPPSASRFGLEPICYKHRLTAQQYSDFLEIFLPVVVEVLALGVKQRYGFSTMVLHCNVGSLSDSH